MYFELFVYMNIKTNIDYLQKEIKEAKIMLSYLSHQMSNS